MKILNEFYDFAKSQGIDTEAIYEEKSDGFVVIAFPEEGEKDCIYDIVIVFYEKDDEVEIYVRKPIKDFDELTLLRKLNELNRQYTDVTFLIDDNILAVKSFLSSQGNIKPVLIKMFSDFQLAQNEFAKITEIKPMRKRMFNNL